MIVSEESIGVRAKGRGKLTCFRQNIKAKRTKEQTRTFFVCSSQLVRGGRRMDDQWLASRDFKELIVCTLSTFTLFIFDDDWQIS